MEGLRGLVDGDHYFDTIAEDAFFEFRYHFPGWPLTIRGRDNLMASFSGYGKTIKLHSGDALVVQRSRDSRVVILEYEAHGFSVWCSRLRYGITRSNRRIFVVQPSQFPKQKEPPAYPSGRSAVPPFSVPTLRWE